ncbi:TetR family transcriptional regulator [Azorhizobium oxalatiphilum]|uniref:TetR family transcriptional regulator n=1 Tax=Azorhizobium oxalatiphilum TaxID=980631 RepID=A0A917BNR8_9HYPH|nr:TetR/AcrR family transcriptional regulator [Azorhizobium oxalatiphilum]GGF51136.1 TetR family transcriptional regulator [Azorhizobium oxalatiphilum]
MPEDRSKDRAASTGRKPRADAERNRLHLLEVAKAAFAQKGPGASLEEIARTAGVGIGTLYRHFPTRDALIAEVYRNETRQLMEAATRLGATRPPVEALRDWLLLFVDYMGTKQGMAEALNSIVGGTTELYANTGPQLISAMTELADRAVKSGEIRLDMEPMDLLRAVGGVVYISAGPDWDRSARRVVDILIAGMRTTPPDA